jgi:hypothetical protein
MGTMLAKACATRGQGRFPDRSFASLAHEVSHAVAARCTLMAADRNLERCGNRAKRERLRNHRWNNAVLQVLAEQDC